MMGICSESDFDQELDTLTSQHKESNTEIRRIERGRGEGNVEVPELIREIIGEAAVENGSKATKALTRSFDISDSSLSAYKKGATSTTSYHTPDPKLKDNIDLAKLRASNRARGKMMLAIRHLTEEKMEDAKPRDLAGIAKDMSVIIRNMEPKTEESNNNTNFIFYAPRPRSESEYDVVEVSE
jgi:hypothetical protein